MQPLEDYLEQQRQRVEVSLDQCLPTPDSYPSLLMEAMRYSVFAGGKRLRPILTLAAAEAVGGDPDMVLPAAGALEYIHTYSMIHDDLPAMDDDDYRRGKLTNHKVYGEAMAILAGDALLTHAFDLISRNSLDGVDAVAQLRVIQELAGGAGNAGMVAGQVADIEAEGK